MKNCLCVCFILISGLIFSQNKEIVKLNRTQLSKANLLSEIVKYKTKDTGTVSWDVVAKVSGKLSSVESKGDSLTALAKSILKGADIGSKIYFDILIDSKKPKNDKTNIQTFAILVTE